MADDKNKVPVRARRSSPLSARNKTKDAGGKTKTGGILGQDKEKRKVSNPFGQDKDATTKSKRRAGQRVQVTRTASGKEKIVYGKDGGIKKIKRKGAAAEGGKKEKLRFSNGGGIKAVKKYTAGGKVVAQGADKDDKKADKKAARQEKRKDNKQARAKKRGDRRLKRDIRKGRINPVPGMAAGAAAASGAASKAAKAAKEITRKNG